MVKCLERLVYERLSEFLDVNNKLSSCQHEFRRGHLCQTQLLGTTHEWAKSLNKGVSTRVIYLDFSKEFSPASEAADEIGLHGNQGLSPQLDCSIPL